MGDFDTTALRSAGLEWHAHAQGSDEECGAGIALVEYADAAADEIDRLRAEVARLRDDAAPVHKLLEDLALKACGVRVAGMRFDDIRALAGLTVEPTKAQRLSDAGDRRDWDECERIEAEDA